MGAAGCLAAALLLDAVRLRHQGVGVRSLQPGDLVFYGSPIHHVALYVGGGQVIHAPQTGDVVRYASVDMMPIVGAVRP